VSFNCLIYRRLENDVQNDLAGCILFLLRERQRAGIGYVPVRFINPLTSKAKVNIIEHLINSNLIERYRPKEEWELEDTDGSNLKFLESGKKEWEKKPNLYRLKNPVYKMPLGFTCLEASDTILRNLHHLNEFSFNHYYYNYRRIKVHIPPEIINQVVRKRIIYELGQERTIRVSNQDDVGLMMWGDGSIFPYDLTRICSDDSFGSHRNFFTAYGWELIKYSSFDTPILIGPEYPDEILLADQLLKTFPDNDFSYYFRVNKRTSRKPRKMKWMGKNYDANNPPHYSRPLIEESRKMYEDLLKESPEGLFTDNPFEIDYEMHRPPDSQPKTEVLGERIFKVAVYGWEMVSQFMEMFPETWNLLHRIKTAHKYPKSDFDTYLDKFCSGISPKPNLKSPLLNIKDPKGKYGRTYYKIVNYVIRQRENKVVRNIWRELKKRDIRFIPVGPYIVIEEKFCIPAKYVIHKEWLDSIDVRLKVQFKEKKIL
jgi:hypothetical protein